MKSLLGEVKLPTRAAMLADTAREEAWRREELGLPDRHFHRMGDLQWEYNRDLARLAMVDPLPPVIEALYKEVHERRRANLPGYKKDIFRLVDANTFQAMVGKEEKGEVKEEGEKEMEKENRPRQGAS